jgi:hypothetical protein
MDVGVRCARPYNQPRPFARRSRKSTACFETATSNVRTRMKRIPFLTILLFQIAILLGLAPVSALGSEEKADALYNRGVTHANAGDTAKALADFTTLIEMRDAPAELKAMARSNRDQLR